jgi:hypothetical protein
LRRLRNEIGDEGVVVDVEGERTLEDQLRNEPIMKKHSVAFEV